MICQQCRDVLSKPNNSVHHTSMKSLTSAVESRCLVCATAWESLTPEKQQTLSDEIGPDDLYPFQVTNLSVNKGYFFMGVGNELSQKTKIYFGPLLFGISVATKTYRSGARRMAIDSLRLSDSTNSPKTFSQANKWIEDCIKNHSKCKPLKESTWYPTRLLDSGPLDQSGESTIHLVETNTTTPSGPYMTLSHSWGQGHTLALNRGSYQTLLDGMPISSLPPTFRDASFTARQLGVRYVWIDALCIFQDKDDLSDWEREASLMHKVYSNSFCNIVAGVTNDSSHSIFRSRNPPSLIPPVSMVRLGKSPFRLYSDDELVIHSTHVVTYKGFWKQVDEAHINTRGWVMQERFMSHRALIFGTEQLFWECREMEAAETNPDGLRLNSDIPFPAHNVQKQQESQEYPDRYAFWDNLVEIYSACALTFPSDKLIALSGIAKQVASLFPDKYLAGMWRYRLEYNLLWYVHGDAESSRYDTYVAPSWSWASIKGKVVAKLLSDPNTELLYRLDDYKLEYATSDETGAVLGGLLRLSGSLRRLKLLRRENGLNRWDSWAMVIDDVEDKWRKAKRKWNPWMVKLDDPQESYDEENESGMLYCMPAEDYPSRPKHNFLTLFLLQVVDPSQATFRRIGVATGDKGYIGHMVQPGESDVGKSQPSTELDGSGKTAIPCAAYKDGIYSIYVL